MPNTVNKEVNGHPALVAGVKTLQTALAQPVKLQIDDQLRAAEIIKLQTFLSTQNATNPPSNKKFDPAKINKSIDDQLLGAKLIELQVASNLT
jgi:diacylglycerol kinase family enzyme